MKKGILIFIFGMSLILTLLFNISTVTAQFNYSVDAIAVYDHLVSGDAMPSSEGVYYSFYGHTPAIPKPIENITDWRWWSVENNPNPHGALKSGVLSNFSRFPDVAFSREGYAIVVYAETYSKGKIICDPDPEMPDDEYPLTIYEAKLVYRKWNGSAWEPEKIIANSMSNIPARTQNIYTMPSIAIDSNGKGIVVWSHEQIAVNLKCDNILGDTVISRGDSRIKYSIWNGTGFQGDLVLYDFLTIPPPIGYSYAGLQKNPEIVFTSQLTNGITRHRALVAWYSYAGAVSDYCPPPADYTLYEATTWVRYAEWNGNAWENAGDFVPDRPPIPPDITDNVTIEYVMKKIGLSPDQYGGTRIVWHLAKWSGDLCERFSYPPIYYVNQIWSANKNATNWNLKAQTFDSAPTSYIEVYAPDLAYLPDNNAIAVYGRYNSLSDNYAIRWASGNSTNNPMYRGEIGNGAMPAIASLGHGKTIAIWENVPFNDIVWSEYNSSINDWTLQRSFSLPSFWAGELDIAAKTGSHKLPHAEWTFSVYQASDGDNRQTDSRNTHANEMKQVGSTNLVNVVRLYDPKKTFDSYSSTNTDYYYMKLNNETRLKRYADLHTGQPNALEDFIAFSLEEYPSKRNMIVTSDHGMAWQGLCTDTGPPDKHLTLPEFRQALTNIGKHFDILSMHNCFMGTIEAVYEIHEFADFAAVSPQAHISGSYGYDKILRNITDNPFIANLNLVRNLVDIDKEVVLPITSDWYDTFSAINLSNVPNLVNATDAFADSILANLTENETVKLARNGTQEMPEETSQVDIYNFSENVKDLVNDINIKNNASKVMAEVNNTVVKFWTAREVPNSHGLNIYFEKNGIILKGTAAQYNMTRFSKNTKWLELIKELDGSSIIKLRLESNDSRIKLNIIDTSNSYVGFSEEYNKDCVAKKIEINGARYFEGYFDSNCNCYPEEIYIPFGTDFTWFVNGSFINESSAFNLTIQEIKDDIIVNEEIITGTIQPNETISGQYFSNAIFLNIPLNSNWNLISIPLDLENNSVENVFGPIMNKVIVINSFESGAGGGARTYDPQLPEFSDLHNIDYLHGYWVKINESANLTVRGTTPINKTINLATGWNLISYLCNSTKNITEVFGSIMNKIIVINGFENGALTYDPLLPEFSDLQELKPNFGYWVKMNESAVLDYNTIC